VREYSILLRIKADKTKKSPHPEIEHGDIYVSKGIKGGGDHARVVVKIDQHPPNKKMLKSPE